MFSCYDLFWFLVGFFFRKMNVKNKTKKDDIGKTNNLKDPFYLQKKLIIVYLICSKLDDTSKRIRIESFLAISLCNSLDT